MHKKNLPLFALVFAIVNSVILFGVLTFEASLGLSVPVIILIFFLTIFVVSLLLLMLSGRAATHFMATVNSNLKSLSEGNFTTLNRESKHFIKTNALFQAIRDMLNGWIIDLLHSAVSVRAASDRINETTKETYEGINVLNQSLADIRQIFEKTSDMLSSISGVTVDLAQSSYDIAGNSEQAVKQVHSASKTALSGGNAVSEVVTTMSTIKEDVSNAKDIILRLESASKEIGNITGTISAISEQTNLLALNAAIESARAGEYGRGFAVVADEVRKLADESHRAAQQIDSLIGKMQLEVSEVVTSIHKVHDEVGSGVGVAENAGDNLKAIIDAVSNAEQLITRISIDVTHQSKNTEHISASIQEITSNAQMGTASVAEITDVVEQQLAHLSQNTQSAASLLKVSSRLDETMSVFDLGIGEQMLSVCDQLKAKLPLNNDALVALTRTIGLSEIHIVDRQGYIKYSSNSTIIGFQFSSAPGTQTYEFMQIFKAPSKRVNQKSAFRDVDGKLFKYAGLISADQNYIIQCGLESTDLIKFKGVSALS